MLLCGFAQSESFDIERARKVMSDPDTRFYETSATSLLKILTRNLLVITPQVMAEVSGLIRRRDIPLSSVLNPRNPVLRMILANTCSETHVSLVETLSNSAFSSCLDLGITDYVLIILAHASWHGDCKPDLIMTDDGTLVNTARGLGIRAVQAQGIPYAG